MRRAPGFRRHSVVWYGPVGTRNLRGQSRGDGATGFGGAPVSMDEPESRRQLPRLKGALSVAGSRAWITLLRRSTARDHLDHRWLFLQRDQVKVVPGLL
ncbi:hypothetical protein GN956_G8778 [Arapaima gigas]